MVYLFCNINKFSIRKYNLYSSWNRKRQEALFLYFSRKKIVIRLFDIHEFL